MAFSRMALLNILAFFGVVTVCVVLREWIGRVGGFLKSCS